MEDFPMNSRKRIRNLVLVTILLLLSLSMSLPMAHSANRLFPFEDVNNDGVYTPGKDRDITAELMTGIFETPNSIVIPAGLKGFTINSASGIALLAKKNITVDNYFLTSYKAGTSLYLYAEEGTITIGTTLKAADSIYIYAGGDVVLNPNASLYGQGSMALIESGEGNILVKGKAILYGKEDIHLIADAGQVTVLPGSHIMVPKGYVTVFGTGDLVIDGNRVEAMGVHVVTEGHLIDFCNNLVKVPKVDGWVYLGTGGSTVDISGTIFQGLDPANLFIEADEVINKN
jgi:hypothetical protein